MQLERGDVEMTRPRTCAPGPAAAGAAERPRRRPLRGRKALRNGGRRVRTTGVGRVLALAWVVLAAALAAPAAFAAPGSIFVYSGNGALNEGYTQFGLAAGKPVVTSAVLPPDLSEYDCVILPVNSVPFDAGQKAIFSSYLASNGRILALGEHGGFAAANATMNDLASSLGAGLSVNNALIDAGFTDTSNIVASSYTTGVSTIRYAATSQLSASGSAQVLVRSQGNVDFIGLQAFGTGFFLLSGDSNVWSDNSGGGYAVQDNDVLVENLCGTGPPATLDLQPEADTNSVGDQHCVTATVEDVFGDPTPGITVRFAVTGSVATGGSDATDGSGQATFCYTGPALPGADVITAYADTNNNAVQDTGEPGDRATKRWVLPPSVAGCKVTYGGRITAANGDKATFGGNAKEPPAGQAQYQDHGPAASMRVHSTVVQSVTCSADGTQASIFGQATIDGLGTFDFRIDLEDLGEPGTSDTYRIRLSNGYDSGKQVLEGGNVQIHFP
jgi:hypothetical protein